MVATATAMRRVTNALVLLFFAMLTMAFSLGSYRWAFKVNRMKPQAINPVMYPTFTYVNTSRLCCTREPYYHLWRTYDWRADGYAGHRQAGEYHRVPVIYVHGNGGSYFCARSLARFLYEANVRQRRLSLRHFDERVMGTVFRTIERNDSLSTLRVGDRVPAWVLPVAEEHVLRDYTPMLATEMFSVDYLEESFTQSGVMILKEARFLNHSMHLLMHNFLSTYRQVLEAPRAASLLASPLLPDNSQADPESSYPMDVVESEYLASCCAVDMADGKSDICAMAKAHLTRYSSPARVQMEVLRVKEKGMWVWAESLGGAVSVMAALMQPSLYAGIVFVGSPTHYPPLFFDVASTWLYKVMSDAVLRHYPQSPSLYQHAANWDADVLPHDTPLHLLAKMRALPSEVLAARLANTTLISVNGGALDDIIPSISGYLRRSTARRPGFYTTDHRLQLQKADVSLGAFHRDISTETMRGVGQAMDHRGLVYGLQFLNHSADSLVLAALLPHTAAHFAPEALLPNTVRDRLFPTVTETLPAERVRRQRREALFARSVRVARKGSGPGDEAAGQPAEGTAESAAESAAVYEKYLTEDEVIAQQFTELCVDNGDSEPIDVNALLTEEEEEAYGYDANGAKPLHLLFGFTTFTPEEVYMPRLELYEDAARTTAIRVDGGDEESEDDAEVRVVPATKLHLPFMRKDARRTVFGRILSTLVSFKATRRARSPPPPRSAHAQVAYPRFCFYVDRAKTSAKNIQRQRSFLQYDVINAAVLQRSAEPLYLGPHYMGNKLAIETHPGYALVVGLDGTTQETRMQITIHESSAVFPIVLAGTLRTLYLVARGNSGVLADDPEEQAQYFFGPFGEGTTQFQYSWKPFSTFEGDLNETHVVYVVGDPTRGRPSVKLNDFERTREASGLPAALTSRESVRWWLDQWPERWLAFFSAYSGIGKLGGAYVLLSFSFFIIGGEAEKWLLHNPALRARWASAVSKRIFYACPLLTTLVLTAAVELVTGTWAGYALQVCRERDPPPLLSDAEMTARMGWLEKTTLVLMFAMRPSYRDCRYSWLRMQSEPIWSSFLEHLSNIYFGFVLTAALATVLLVYMAAVLSVGWVIHAAARTKRVFHHPRLARRLLFAWWSLPTLSWILSPALPLSYRYLFSVTVALLVLPVVPWCTKSGYAFPRYMTMVCVACTFPAHFDGAVLTIRNHVMLHRTPDAFWDLERNTNITPYQVLVWLIVQAALGINYVTLYLVGSDEVTLKRADARKENGKTLKAPAAKGTEAAAPEKGGGYVLGDWARGHPCFRNVVSLSERVLPLLAVWITVVVMRRPMEGGVILLGNMILLLSMLTKLLKQW